ncbi:MAG TPA: hypothetical protein VKU60_21135 [Chloroflexota bacterium]|nr:hypothetical protein [Chloroflexota bacterium]
MAEPNLEEVDQHLVQVVEALQSAVAWGMAHRDDHEALKKTIADCKDLIDEVMDATILNW